jgi:hypothetical protein
VARWCIPLIKSFDTVYDPSEPVPGIWHALFVTLISFRIPILMLSGQCSAKGSFGFTQVSTPNIGIFLSE